MKTLLLLILVLTFGTFAFAQTQSKCFQFGGLKDGHIVTFRIDGARVSGAYRIEPDYDSSQAESYEFKGTRKGNTLTIKFANKILKTLPPKTTTFIWTLLQSQDKELLRLKMSIKDRNLTFFFH